MCFCIIRLVHLAITSQLSEFGASLNEVLSRFAFIMVLNLMLRTYSTRIFKNNVFKSADLSTARFIAELKGNTEFRAELAKALLPLMRQLVVLGFLLNPEIDNKEVKLFEQDQFYEDFEELNMYLKQSFFKTTSDVLMSEAILIKCLISEEILDLHFVKLLEIIQEDISSLPLTFMISNKEVGFHLIDLPDNFYDLSTLYMDRKCELCRGHSRLGNKCVCLICEQVLCNYICNDEISNAVGNLNNHAVNISCGLLSVH